MSTAQQSRSNGSRRPAGPLARMPARLWDVATPLVHQVLRTPGLGPAQGMQASLARLADAAWDLGRAGTRYSAVVVRVWTDVAVDIASEMPSLATDPATVLDPRALLEHVYDVAERHFSQAFTTDEYIDAQAELGATTMAYRVAEQPIARALLALVHAASLADVDDAHRNVQDLRRTVRDLRRRVRTLEREVAASRRGDEADGR
jgi:hypothetical protein